MCKISLHSGMPNAPDKCLIQHLAHGIHNCRNPASDGMVAVFFSQRSNLKGEKCQQSFPCIKSACRKKARWLVRSCTGWTRHALWQDLTKLRMMTVSPCQNRFFLLSRWGHHVSCTKVTETVALGQAILFKLHVSLPTWLDPTRLLSFCQAPWGSRQCQGLLDQRAGHKFRWWKQYSPHLNKSHPKHPNKNKKYWDHHVADFSVVPVFWLAVVRGPFVNVHLGNCKFQIWRLQVYIHAPSNFGVSTMLIDPGEPAKVAPIKMVCMKRWISSRKAVHLPSCTCTTHELTL